MKSVGKTTGLLRRLLRDRRGVVGMMFGLMLIPLLGAVGIAVDATRYFTVKDQMQFAMDTGGIAIGMFQASCTTTCTNSDTLAEAGAVAQVFYNANIGTTSTQISYLQNGAAEVDLSASPSYLASLMGFLKVPTLTLAVQGTYKLPVNVEVALVLDNTTSMSETLGGSTTSKIAELKTGVTSFLTNMKSVAKAANRVKVAMVPFTTDVNIQALTGYQPFINWLPTMYVVTPPISAATCPSLTAATTIASALMVPTAHYVSFSGTTCSAYGITYSIYTFPTLGWGPLNPSGWSGCVIDRTQPYDITNTVPTAGLTADATWYIPDNINCQGGPVTALNLTDVFSDLTSNTGTSVLATENSSMKAAGFTNLSIGFFWGWQLLSPNTPGSVSSSASRTQKYIIMMTDGQNTMNRWNNAIFSGSTTAIDTRTKSTCDAIKADQNGNIKIFTIGTSDANTSLLNYCSSGSNYQFVITNATQLTTAFNAIAGQITNLRIAS